MGAFIHKRDVNRRKWEILKQDTRPNRWRSLYATLNLKGSIAITRFTHEALGSPEAYVILFDPVHETIGLKPARAKDANAVLPTPKGRHGGLTIKAGTLISQFSVYINETTTFPRCFIDRDGVLILDMRDTRSASRGRNKARAISF